jgi:hypothetical protein
VAGGLAQLVGSAYADPVKLNLKSTGVKSGKEFPISKSKLKKFARTDNNIVHAENSRASRLLLSWLHECRKFTLLNHISKSDVYVADQLFANGPNDQRVELPGGHVDSLQIP